MRQRYGKAVLVLALAGMIAVPVSLAARAQDRDERAAESRTLKGTWTFEVTVRNCQTGAALGTPFLSYLTFAQGGTLVETTANPMFFPAVRGPGHGVWSSTGHGTYLASSTAFITLNGVLVKTQVITQKIVLGENSDEATTPSAEVQFFSPGGTVLVTGCATATGKRFELKD